MPNRQDLPSQLAKARQQLQKAQSRVAELEAQVFEGLPNLAEVANGGDRYHRALDNMLEGCQIIGFDWTYLYINDTAARHGQYTKDELLGYTMMERYPDIEKTPMFAVLQRCMQERRVERIENEFSYPDRASAWFELSVQPVPEGIFILSLDITERKLAKETLQKDRDTLEQRVVERTADLQAALIRVEAILNNSPDAILLAHADLSIQQTNSSFDNLFDCEEDEYFGKSLLTLFHSDDASKLGDLSQINANQQNGKHIEVRAIRKDNTTFDAELNRGVIKGGGLVYIIRDISERKAQERQLRYHASIQESVSDAVIATDMDFRIQSWNHAAEAIYGWSAAEAIGQLTAEILQTSYETEAEGKRIRQDFLENGAWQGEIIQRHRDGSPINILASVNLFKDEMGPPLGVVSVNRDITERKRATDALQESAAEIHDLYNNAPCGYHSIDKDGLIVQINDTELQWLGYGRDEVVGRLKITALLTPASLLVFQKTHPLFMERGWMNDVELDMVRKDGSIMHILLNATAIYDEDGQYLKNRSTLFDITELQQAQQVIIESEARYRLLAENIGDVIAKTNLNGIRTFITPSCYALLGYNPDELIDQPSIDIVHPDDRSDALAAVMQAVSEGKTAFSFVRRFLHKAGHDIWVEATNNIIYDAATKTPVEIIGVIRDITKRKHAEDIFQNKMEEERQFQSYLKALHEIIIELTLIDDLDAFYKRTVELGREGLGFERLAMFLYDEQDGNATGTFGTDAQGNLVDERGIRFKPDPNGIMQRSFERAERFYFNEHTTLYSAEVPVGSGWNAAAVLWNGTQSLGWFVTDNLLSYTPASKSLLDIIGLYALSVGTLLAQKQTELALREREALYRFLTENISDLIMRSTLTSECLYVSPSVQTILGYTDKELIGKQTFDLVHPDDQTTISNVYVSALERNDLIVPHQYRAKHKAGHYVWLETVGKPLFKDGTNEISGVIASSRDITKRKQAEEALRQSQQMLFNVLENIPVRIFWKDRNSVYRGCNTRYAQTVGLLSPNEIVGKTDHDLLPDWAAKWEAADREVMVSDIPKINIEELYKDVDGSLQWLSSNKVPLRSAEGEVTGVLVTIEDITGRKHAEEALRESEERFRLLLDAAPIATVISDQTGHITLVNIQAETLFGYSRSELIGQSIETLLPAYASEKHVHNRATYMVMPRVGQMGLGLELFARRKDASIFPVEIELSHIENDTGLLVMSFVVDITERKRVAEELEQQRSFLRSVIDVSPSMIFVKDYDSRFVLANPLMATMYNTTVEDIIGKTDAAFNPSTQEVNSFIDADRHVITSGERFYIEEPITNSKGETHWLQTTKVPIISADGKSKYVLGVSTDITERKIAEEALRESEVKYRSLIETMRGGFVIFDLDKRITFINDRFCELLGYSREEYMGTRAADYVDPGNLTSLESQLKKRQQMESSTYELLFRHKNGTPVYLLVSGSPLLGRSGEYIGSFAVVTDITLQKQAEDVLREALVKEKELGDLKTRFVSMASHEFRTPLATILALVETLSAYRHKLPEEQIEQRLDKIKDQIGHLKDIMEDVLMLAQMQARRVEFNPVKLDLDALSRSVLDEFESRTDVMHRLEYTVSEGNHEASLDRKLMRQIISNLVSNAIKYSPEDKPIRINLEYTDSTVILKISDEGIGIPEGDLSHLFEPFHRAANVGVISGTGLGLVITREAVELHGGTITVKSQLDVGTTFTIHIPITTGEERKNDENLGD